MLGGRGRLNILILKQEYLSQMELKKKGGGGGDKLEVREYAH